MATQPMSQPDAMPDQGGASPQGGAPAAGPTGGAQQANQLQVVLGQLMKIAATLGQQNEIIQPEMQQIVSACRQAFVKTVQGTQPQPQPMSPQGM